MHALSLAVLKLSYYHFPTDYSASPTRSAVLQVIADKEVSLKPGRTSGGVKVVYSSPNKGRVTVNLMNANGDILIQIDARFDWYTWKNILVLNSKKVDGNWGTQVQPTGFPFPCCGYTTTITLHVEIGETAFVISANGKELVSYPYREGLAPPVDTVTYYFGDTGATEKAELQSISVCY